MSCAAKYNFTICQGATVDFTLEYTDANGSMVDLRDYSARMQLRDNVSQSATLLYLTLSSSLNPDGTGLNFSGSASTGFVSPVSGNIGIYISALTSSMLSFNGKAYYDLFIYSGSFADKILEGKIDLDPRVTV
jgi:hypothetical protein